MLKKEDKKAKEAQRSSQLQQEIHQHELEAQQRNGVHSILHIPDSSELSKAHVCGGLTYVILGVITILLAIIEIIVTSFGAATERYYDSPQSGRMVAMIILAVVAAATIVVLIYALLGVRSKHTKPLHSATVVLVILALIQALIIGVSINITDRDELSISRFLSESFYRAKDGDPKQLKLWDETQSALECCGLYSPEDYRDPYAPFHFPPDIPASCCPSYNFGNTTRQKEREMCKANGSYYKIGCKLPVLQIVKGASITTIVITSLLIIAELVIAVLGGVLSTKRKVEKHENIEITPQATKVSDPPQQTQPATPTK